MTFEKALIQYFKEGCFIKCKCGTDVHRVIYMLRANGYRFSENCQDDMSDNSKAIAILKSALNEYGVLYIYMQSEENLWHSGKGIIAWSNSCNSRRVSVSEIDQSLNPNYR